MYKLLSFLLVVPMINLLATGNDSINQKNKQLVSWDTTRYIKFTKVLIVGVFQSYRNFGNEMETLIPKDGEERALGSQNFQAESNLISGVTVCFDKFSFAFSTRSNPPVGSSLKGNTRMFNIGFNVGDNRYVFENYYRRFTGFYEKNHPHRDSTGNVLAYDLRPGMTSSLLMSKFMYFTNHERFSFKSGFGSNYRQLKSAGTWIVGGDFNVYNLNNDTAFIHPEKRKYYNDYSSLKSFRSVGVSVHGGFALTVVLFKAWFLSGYFTVGPEQQWRRYGFSDYYRRLSYISWSGTGRLAAGLNLKKCYFLFSFNNDYALYNNSFIKLRANSISGNATFGWRFNVKTPQYYENFKKSKWYGYF